MLWFAELYDIPEVIVASAATTSPLEGRVSLSDASSTTSATSSEAFDVERMDVTRSIEEAPLSLTGYPYMQAESSPPQNTSFFGRLFSYLMSVVSSVASFFALDDLNWL